MRLNAKYKRERDLSDAANERRRFGEAYKPLLARVAGKAILGEGNQVGDNTLTLN